MHLDQSYPLSHDPHDAQFSSLSNVVNNNSFKFSQKYYFFPKNAMMFPCPFFGASFFDLVETGAALALGAGAGSSSENDSQAASCFVTDISVSTVRIERRTKLVSVTQIAIFVLHSSLLHNSSSASSSSITCTCDRFLFLSLLGCLFLFYFLRRRFRSWRWYCFFLFVVFFHHFPQSLLCFFPGISVLRLGFFTDRRWHPCIFFVVVRDIFHRGIILCT